MIIVNFQVEDKTNRLKFFQEAFLMANTKFEVILGIPFIKLSNTDVLFGKKTLTQRTDTTNEALSTTKQVQIINKKNFVIMALIINNKTFVMYMAIQK